MLGEEIDRAHFAFSEMGLVAIKEMGDDAVVAGMATTRATITIDQHEPRG